MREIGIGTYAGSIRVDSKRLLDAVKTEKLRGIFQSVDRHELLMESR